ncbi:MAG TPA: AAA family ATPase [Gaiellales bacterium]|nr:AAA family ATPase [Gaiellales bacterium]
MAVCPHCGQENPDGFRFCGSCGSAMAAAAPTEERKVVTVLFADLVGFTGRSERMDVEDVRGTLAPYHALLRRQLEHYGGTVEKFIGDAVMALFGAPVSHEDDPERAVRAALAIRAAIDRLNEQEPGLDLHVRVGVNTGEALVVLGADAARGEGMASGDVVNTAARLQAAAPVDGILVGETTFRATDRAVAYRESDPVVAKGKAGPVPAWEAVEARARLGVDVIQRPTTPLVGRRDEIDLLLDALRRSRAERAVQLVTLVGVPGIGKSRLVWELFQAVEADPDFITWRQGRSLPYGEGVTYWALGEMVAAQAGILESDSAEEAGAKLRETVSDLIEDPGEAAWVTEHVRALAGLEAGGGGGDDRRSEAAAAWRRFLEALAERHPLVLVFEDMHWADDALLDFVDHLVDWASGVPMLVVCTARPELLDRRRGWGGGKRNALTIALSPLLDSDIARLMGTLLEQAVLPADTQATLLATAEGNPLYAEEYVRMLIDRGHLRHDGGRWRLTGADLPVPESVHGLIAARLDDLPADHKQLLQDAAVLGKVVWLGALVDMSGLGRFEVEERLHALERREMLRRERRTSVGGELEYAFRHVLVRDVAYGQIPRAQRAEKHRRAAAWIESLSADRENAADMVAHHYSQALDYARDAGRPTGDLERLTRLAHRDAAERADALNSIASALRHYHRALALWPEDDAGWPMLVVDAADAGMTVDTELMTERLTKAARRLAEAGDCASAAKAEILIGFGHWNEAQTTDAVAAFSRAQELVERAEPSPTAAYVMTRIAINLMLRGQYEPTLALCERADAVARRFGLDEIRAHILNTRGVTRVTHGDIGGCADQEESIAIAERLNSADAMIRGYKNYGSTLMEQGDLTRAAELERRGVEAARRFGADYQLMWFETELGILAYWAGDWDAAEAAFGRLDAWVASVGPHYMEAAGHSCRAKLRSSRGDLEGGRRDVEGALVFARRSREAQSLLPTLADAATVAIIGGGREAPARVAQLFDEAVGAVEADVSGAFWLTGFALALALTGQRDRFAAVQRIEGPWRWLSAAKLIAGGRYAEAADELGAIGSRPDEALARLLHARVLIEAGDRAGGEAELRRALAFWDSVGAGSCISLADALVAKSA